MITGLSKVYWTQNAKDYFEGVFTLSYDGNEIKVPEIVAHIYAGIPDDGKLEAINRIIYYHEKSINKTE